MRKTGILNPVLNEAISRLGHKQFLAVCDAGTPLPKDAVVLDLSLVPGIPSIADVVHAICGEMFVESFFYASESDGANPEFISMLHSELPCVPFQKMTHEEFKKTLNDAAAVVRTGECTPYANVALIAGVPF